jgi:hypothetical protein
MTIRRTALALALGLVTAASGCAIKRPMDTHKAEAASKPVLQRELRARIGDDSITVDRVKREVAHERRAGCDASVSYDAGQRLDVRIAGDYDLKTGTLHWHTTG